MKVIKLKTNITVVLNDGTVLTHGSCTEEMHQRILDNQDDDDAVKAIMMPEFFKKKEVYEAKTELLNDMNSSKYLTVKGASVYLESVSQLSLPEDLAMAIYQAEKKGDKQLIDTYKNFWTLASLNPDSRARTNLFWFLKKYGMTISRSGLFVAYRNVVVKEEGSEINSTLAKEISKLYLQVKMKWKKNPKNYFMYYDGESNYKAHKGMDPMLEAEDYVGNLQELYDSLSDENKSTTYTDGYTGKFTIKIGEPVTMPRKDCDSKQENTCSRGLHVAGRSWLQNGYFGNTSLIVLVNPADVVAVPPNDSYGKMRCCAYYPVALVERNQDGQIINDNIPDGFEDDFIDRITYQGNLNEKETFTYKLEIPNIPELNTNKIYKRLDKIKATLSKKLLE